MTTKGSAKMQNEIDKATEADKQELARQNDAKVNAIMAGLAKAKAELAALDKAKADDFQEEAADFWKPSKKGEELIGIYKGYITEARYKQHLFAVKHPKTGEPWLMRINGTRILSKELNKGSPDMGVKIIYDGETKTGEGQKLQLWRVFWARGTAK